MSRGLGKIERKILQGMKESDRYYKKQGEIKPGYYEQTTWNLSHYVEGNCKKLFIDNDDLYAEFSHSTYIKTYNAIKSLERKGLVETYIHHGWKPGEWPATNILVVSLKH